MSILNKIVSYYPNKNATTQGVDTNLLTILHSTKHKGLLLNLRASPEEVQKQLKETLPCYTVAGRFSRRSKGGLIEPSGLADVDLDSAGDCDIPYLLNELKKIENIAYAGLSCRGNRLHCIVPFLYPDRYEEHYKALIGSFREYGLPMGDECHKQVSQPRFISLNDDSTQFFNHSAKPYSLLPVKKVYHAIRRNPTAVVGSPPENPFQWCVEQTNKSNEFVTDKRHPYIVALARYCNIKGLDEQVTLTGCLGFAQSDFDDKEITDIVTHIYKTQSDTHNERPFNSHERIRDFVPLKEKKAGRDFQEVANNVEDSKQLVTESVPEAWDQQIEELETFFQTSTFQMTPLKLNPFTTITDIPYFVESHLAMVKANCGKRTFEPYLQRLIELKKILLLPL
ncbi:hypothetical protein BH11BAC1_BH11BAC1_24050 [soil metagenome]